MKRKILIAIIITLCSNLFAGFIVQQGADLLTLYYHLETSCFHDSLISDKQTEAGLIYGTDLDILYEFSFDEETIFHPYSGATLGIKFYGIPLSLTGGCNITLKEYENIALELDTGSRVGIASEIFSGTLYSYINPYINLILVNKNRTGWFASIGSNFSINSNIQYYKTYGFETTNQGLISLKLNLGYRF